MFTGLVTHIGILEQINHLGNEYDWVIRACFEEPLSVGESIAVNGVCLTVTAIADDQFTVRLSHETLRCTQASQLNVGDHVNLERALKVSDRLGGHIVTGHVDDVVAISSIEQVGECYCVSFCMPKALHDFVIPKGSVALDGVSLTVNAVERDSFSVMIIPHTLEQTVLKAWQVGREINIECDMLIKAVIRHHSLEEGHA